MDIVDYINNIKDEIEDSAKYIKKAMACKDRNSNHASRFAKMSEEELNHAAENVKMFEEDYSELDETEKGVLDDMHDSLISMYLDESAKVGIMQQTFARK